MTARFAMSDANWKQIGAPWDMPNEARSTIDALVNWFLETEAGIARNRPTAASRDALLKVSNEAIGLVDALTNLPPGAVKLVVFPSIELNSKVRYDPEFGAELPTEAGWGISPLNRIQSFQQEIDNVKAIADRLRAAASRFEKNQPGADASNYEWFVAECDKVLFRYTGRHIDRSKGRPSPLDFVTNVFRLADKRIGDGSILEAVKKVMATLK